jgi:hypothetical protein
MAVDGRWRLWHDRFGIPCDSGRHDARPTPVVPCDDAAVERAAKALAGKPRCYCDDDWRVPKFEGCPQHGTGEWPAEHHRRQAEAVLRAAGGQDAS